MVAVRTVAVVGGGCAGFAAAILLAGAGAAVDVVEIAPDVTALGSGLTLQGNALRVLQRLGVLDAAIAMGHVYDSIALRRPDGGLLAELADAPTGGPGVPSSLGMRRPDLARLLAGRAAAVGVTVRTGRSVESLAQDADGVDLVLSDGTRGRYDLVVGADGLRSRTRGQLGIALEPTPLGMAIWRVSGRRPAALTRTELVHGGPVHIAGYCPTGADSFYGYLVEDATDRGELTPAAQLALVRELAAGYGGLWTEILKGMTDPARINVTRFEWHLLDGPWHRGRVVLIGDAVHSCPPTLAQGAAMALEDAAVLAELLRDGHHPGEELFAAFTARRVPRVREVVDASVQLCRWLLAGERGDVPGLMHRISTLVTEQP